MHNADQIYKFNHDRQWRYESRCRTTISQDRVIGDLLRRAPYLRADSVDGSKPGVVRLVVEYDDRIESVEIGKRGALSSYRWFR